MQEEKKVIFNLTEHDASQLLSLIKKEIDQENQIWHPYWRRLAGIVEIAIENAAKADALRYSACLKDNSDGSRY